MAQTETDKFFNAEAFQAIIKRQDKCGNVTTEKYFKKAEFYSSKFGVLWCRNKKLTWTLLFQCFY